MLCLTSVFVLFGNRFHLVPGRGLATGAGGGQYLSWHPGRIPLYQSSTSFTCQNASYVAGLDHLVPHWVTAALV